MQIIPAWKMAVYSFCKFQVKSCFVFLLCITFAVSITLYVTDISLDPSKEWINNISQKVSLYYQALKTQTSNNYTVVILPPLSERNFSKGLHKNADEQNATKVPQQKPEETTEQPQREDYHHQAYPANYHYNIDEPRKCQEQDPFLILMVPVAPRELDHRDAIRSTWGSETVVQGKTVTVLFMLGLPGGGDAEKQQEQLNQESRQNHDLIQSNFMDTYLNLTIKTMVIMDWLTKNCPQATFAMKIDSDMFLNLENLMSLLLSPNTPKENYITGMVMWNRPVVRNKHSKWYVPEELYADEFYPTYLLGMGYVFTNDLPPKLVEASKDIKPFNIEDAYLGMCLKKIGVSPSTAPDPSKFRAYFSGQYSREEFARVITFILGSPQQLISFWKDLKQRA